MKHLNLLLAILLLGMLGCSDNNLVRIEAEPPSTSDLTQQLAAGKTTIDISGDWDWNEVILVKVTPFVAGLLGIEPEGPVTHITCRDEGTMTLTQINATFSGESSQTGLCVTRGGQEYPNDGDFTIENGRVTGHAFHFDWVLPIFNCPHHGSISVEGETAVGLRATGRCLLPSNPGVSKTISFEATRP